MKYPVNRAAYARGVAASIISAAVIAGIGIAIMRSSRTFNVDGGNGGAPVNAVTTTPQAKQSVSAMETFADPATPLSPLDRAAYDAKMLALAHIPPPPPAPVRKASSTPLAASSTATLPPAGTAESSTASLSSATADQYPPFAIAPARSQIASLWPVPLSRAPYPDDGALLPFTRIVAYYGNLYSTQMGVLGEYPEDQMLAMLASTTAMWQAADPSTRTVPALDYIAVTAQGSAGADGKYRARMPAGQIDEILRMAARINGIVILDVQVGQSNVETEVPLLAHYLELPQVELALDPEFDMHNGAKPGTVIGTMDASDINWAANYLANLVNEYHLPPKILIVHRFTQAMVTHTADITPLPQVQIVMDMDGFGSELRKLNTYYSVIEPEPVQFTGFKLFYKNDTNAGHLMTPQDVLRLSPQPSFIQYQ